MGPRDNFYEDFRVGQRFDHGRGRTITDFDAVLFATTTLQANPLHFDAHRARTEGHPGIVVDPLLVWNVVFGLTVEDLSWNVWGAGNLGYPRIDFLHPVHAGDSVRAESEVLAVTPWKKGNDRGVVHVVTRGRNQDGTVVLEYERKILLQKRGAGDAATGSPS